MAIKSQFRLKQLTGSFGTAAGKISDQKAAASTGSLAHGDLSGILSDMASAIKRIHGADSFSQAAAGEFHHSISPLGSADADLGTNSAGWGNVYLGTAVKFSPAGTPDVVLTRVAGAGIDLSADNGTGTAEFQFRATAPLVMSSSAAVKFHSHKQTAAPDGLLLASGSSSYSTFISTFGAGNQSILDALNTLASGGTREKEVVEVSSTATVVNLSSVSGLESCAPAQLDVYVNGTLLRSGTGQDYNVTNNSRLTFEFNLEKDDIVQVIKI